MSARRAQIPRGWKASSSGCVFPLLAGHRGTGVVIRRYTTYSRATAINVILAWL